MLLSSPFFISNNWRQILDIQVTHQKRKSKVDVFSISDLHIVDLLIIFGFVPSQLIHHFLRNLQTLCNQLLKEFLWTGSSTVFFRSAVSYSSTMRFIWDACWIKQENLNYKSRWRGKDRDNILYCRLINILLNRFCRYLGGFICSSFLSRFLLFSSTWMIPQLEREEWEPEMRSH